MEAFLRAAVPAALAAVLAFACGGNTAPEADLGAGSSGASSSGASGGASGGASADAATDSGNTSNGGSSSGGSDGGEPPPGVDVFASAPAYTAKTGKNTLKIGEHPGLGDPAKQPCLKCHSAGGEGPLFFAGGTVFKEAAATSVAPQVEVRFVDANGKSVSTYTDNLGNFIVTQKTATTAGLKFPVSVGVRDAKNKKSMSATITSGDCNSPSCHGGTQGFIHVP